MTAGPAAAFRRGVTAPPRPATERRSGRAGAERAPLVFVSVGTDVHPFDRVLGWVGGAAADYGPTLRWAVQHGWSRPPVLVAGRARDRAGHP